mmetsp:Transcript_6616/g.10921  ORF Transcript_6616/g.10921 Transcript_6616/m.10921 type:complete len:201 (+) Transcript_6616:630-1232(+)
MTITTATTPISTLLLLLLTIASSTAASVTSLLLLMVSAAATVLLTTTAAALLVHTRHDRLRRLLQNDAFNHLLHLIASIRRTNDGSNAHLGTRCRKGWDLDFSATLVLHFSNDTTGTPNAHSHVLVRNLHLDSQLRRLVLLGTQNIFNHLLGQGSAFPVWMRNRNGTNVWIIRVTRLWDLNVGTAAVLNALDRRSSLSND